MKKLVAVCTEYPRPQGFSFRFVYGEYELRSDGQVAIGGAVKIVIPMDDIIYEVEGLEGTVLEPTATDNETLVMP